jgi:hypothetical protein
MPLSLRWLHGAIDLESTPAGIVVFRFGGRRALCELLCWQLPGAGARRLHQCQVATGPIDDLLSTDPRVPLCHVCMICTAACTGSELYSWCRTGFSLDKALATPGINKAGSWQSIT